MLPDFFTYFYFFPELSLQQKAPLQHIYQRLPPSTTSDGIQSNIY